MKTYKLFYMLLGATTKGRYTEQHDVFFCIAKSLQETISLIKNFWPEDRNNIHIDAWKEVTVVDGYEITIIPKNAGASINHLFFINLGGYLQNDFEEHHHKILCVAQHMGTAIKRAKQTDFYKHYNAETGSHVDNKWAIDVDEIYNVARHIATASEEYVFYSYY